MADEIEFKFLVKNNSWKKDVVARYLVIQGYVSTSKELTSRLRTTVNLETEEKKGFVTFKGKSSKTLEGASKNPEFEYEIPYEEAHLLIGLTNLKIKKIRNIIPINSEMKWEVDEYLDAGLNNLVSAELEVKPGQALPKDLPSWLGDDVSNDFEYKNVHLAIKAAEYLSIATEDLIP